jgi:hypothetical protein
LLGSLVVTAGVWLACGGLALPVSMLTLLSSAGMLYWQGRTTNLIWAWSTLLLGLASLSWPILTMVQIRTVTDQPSDEQMGSILSAILMGLFSAVFWIVFSYGLFKRTKAGIAGPEEASVPKPTHQRNKKNR